MAPHILGIYRERQHSPGREFDDTEILRLVAKHVEAAGCQVHLKTAAELRVVDDPLIELGGGPCPSLVFLMCERRETLELLKPMEMQGIPHVNPLQAVLNTYRDRMIPLLAASAIPIPRSQILSSNQSDPDYPMPQLPAGPLRSGTGQASMEPVASPVESLGLGPFPIWVKRADVHNTQCGDVRLTPSQEELQVALSALHDRGISRVVLQQHIPGDLIKFYGIGTLLAGHRKDAWFKWFYHRNQDLARHPFSEEVLQALAQRAAFTLGLEVYGGDAIVTPGGEIFLIDINAWPSFALFREEASPRVATWLLRRLTPGALP